MITPKYDDCMKELFRNRTVLTHFISDVLGIPWEQIRSVRRSDTFLRKKYRREKQGILDVLAELNDDTKINIEIQVKVLRHWDKRQIFYLSKLYTMDLKTGEDYSNLKRCVGISILDFNLTDRAEYHSVYRLRDEEGYDFSDMLELHVLELGKKLTGQSELDDWIRFFNIKTEEDLEMLKMTTISAGVTAAIRELQIINMNNPLRISYEAHMKRLRDEKAREAYVREQGLVQGMEQRNREIILRKHEQGVTAQEIAMFLELPVEKVEEVIVHGRQKR